MIKTNKHKKKSQHYSTSLSRFLFETTVEPLEVVLPTETMQQQNISLDQIVDHYFVQYEKESMPNSDTGMPLQPPSPDSTIRQPPRTSLVQGQPGSAGIGLFELRNRNNKIKTMSSFLFEADDPAASDPNAGAPADDAGGGIDDMIPGGDDGSGAPEPDGDAEKTNEPDVQAPKININEFANRLARLITNHETLLDPQSVILNRAQAYMTRNYNSTVAKELMSLMELQFGMMPLSIEAKAKALSPETPIAVGAAGNLVGS